MRAAACHAATVCRKADPSAFAGHRRARAPRLVFGPGHRRVHGHHTHSVARHARGRIACRHPRSQLRCDRRARLHEQNVRPSNLRGAARLIGSFASPPKWCAPITTSDALGGTACPSVKDIASTSRWGNCEPAATLAIARRLVACRGCSFCRSRCRRGETQFACARPPCVHTGKRKGSSRSPFDTTGAALPASAPPGFTLLSCILERCD